MWCLGNLDASEARSCYKVHICIHIHTYTYIYTYIHIYTKDANGLPSFLFAFVAACSCTCVCMFLCVQCCDASELLGWTACKFDSRMENINTIKRKRARDGGYKVMRHITPSCAQHTIECRQISISAVLCNVSAA